MADDKHRHVPALGQLHESHGAVLYLADAARRALQRAVVQGLDGVHNQYVRLLIGYRLQYVLQPRLRQHQQIPAGYPQPLGPQLQLPHRLLSGYVQHPVLPAQAGADLEHQRALPYPRRTAYQNQRALYRAAAQYPVQLPHSSGKPDFLRSINLCQGDSLYRVKAAPSPCRLPGRTPLRRRLLLDNRVPCPAGGTLPRPLRRLVPALRAVKYGALLCHGGTSQWGFVFILFF